MANTDVFADFVQFYRERQASEMSLAGVSRTVPRRSKDLRQRRRADAGRDRRTRDDRHLQGSAPRPIFMNRTIRVYPAFAGFYGMEETIERIVCFFRHAAQGLEERKQILYLLGPVGGGKSSLAERLKALMEVNPDLCAEGRRRAQPGVRKPALPVRSREAGRCSRSATAFRGAGSARS